MGDLIGALVEYSRVNSAELVITDVDLNELLNEALDLVSSGTSGRSIQWHRTRLPMVRGDEHLLREVLVNLVSNAVKYTRTRDPGDRHRACEGAAHHIPPLWPGLGGS